MRAIPYLIPAAITMIFIATAATPFIGAAMGLILGIAFLRKRIGRFSVAEVVAEYDFFHHSPLMANLKSASGLFFAGFNIWVLVFLAHNTLAVWALAVFIYSVVILNSNFAVSLAHDLMHSARKLDRWLSTLLFLQNGFFYIEADHLYIHHRHVGTSGDPASAEVGEGLYTYFRRSIAARFGMIFFEGNTLPKQRQNRIIRSNWLRLTACTLYLVGAASVSWPAFGCVLAQFALVTLIYESVTYIQHYGLRRELNATGRAEVVQLHHAWNCYYRTSAWLHYMMPVHSIHHLREERLDEIRDFAGCEMPRPFATMMVTAFFPTRWSRLMDGEVARRTQQESA